MQLKGNRLLVKLKPKFINCKKSNQPKEPWHIWNLRRNSDDWLDEWTYTFGDGRFGDCSEVVCELKDGREEIGLRIGDVWDGRSCILWNVKPSGRGSFFILLDDNWNWFN